MVDDLPTGPFGAFLNEMARLGSGEATWAVIEVCSRLGVFHADEFKCLAARPVNSAIPIEDLNALADLDPEHPRFRDYQELTNTPDAWHILYASGDILGFFDLATHELPKLIWQRNGTGGARIYDYQTIKRRVQHVLNALCPGTEEA